MKKFASILLCVILMFTAATVLGEPITSVSGLFTYELPENCFKVDSALLDALFKQLDTEGFAEGYANALGLNKEAGQNITATLDQIDLSAVDLLYVNDLSGGATVTVTPMVGLTQDNLSLIKSELDKQLVVQYNAFGITDEDIQPQELATFGENQYYVMYVTLENIQMHLYITYDDAGNQLCFNFTNFDEETVRTLLESVVLVPAQAAE